MQHFLRFSILHRWLVVLAAGGLATPALVAERFPVWVVAEQNPPTGEPASNAGAPYVLVDGGFIDEGDSVANERVADAGAVRAAVAAGLDAAGFQPTADGDAGVIIIYHWGVMRPSKYDQTGYRGLSFNARARIRLVADVRHVERIEQVLEAGINGMPWYMPSRTRDFLSYARDSRYFLVVSAYDAAAASEGQAVLRWRTKLSVTDNEANMQVAVQTLAIDGSEFFGAAVDPKSVRLTVPDVLPDTSSGAEPPSSAAWSSLVEHEREQLLGKSLAQDYIEAFRRQTPLAVDEPSLPPELQVRLDNYRQEKRRLQDALATRVAGVASKERAKVIDAFNRENADAIAALDDEERAIRAELARVAAKQEGDDAAVDDRLFDTEVDPARPAEARSARGKL